MLYNIFIFKTTEKILVETLRKDFLVQNVFCHALAICINNVIIFNIVSIKLSTYSITKGDGKDPAI